MILQRIKWLLWLSGCAGACAACVPYQERSDEECVDPAVCRCRSLHGDYSFDRLQEDHLGPNRHADADSHAHRCSDANRHARTHAHRYADANSCTNSHADPNAHSSTDRNAGRSGLAALGRTQRRLHLQ